MSTTRIIFIIVCIVVAACVFTIGIVMQKNDPNSGYSLTNAINPRAAQKRKEKRKMFRSSGSYITLFLLLVLVVLYLIFSGK